MGHCTSICTYPVTTDTKAIFAELNADACRESDSRSGLDKPIRFIDYVCKDEEEAREYIRSHDRGWYDQLAVKYYQPVSNESKKFLAAKEKLSELRNEFRVLDRTKLEIKAEFITCKHCKSKINTKYFYGHCCPLCREDARPQTLLNKLNKLEDKIKLAEQKLKEASTKEVYWMVKTEYHV